MEFKDKMEIEKNCYKILNRIDMVSSHTTFTNVIQTGTGFQYVDYDPDLENGEGAVTIKSVPWNQVFIDPTANLIDEANFAILDCPIHDQHLDDITTAVNGILKCVQGERYGYCHKDCTVKKIDDLT